MALDYSTWLGRMAGTIIDKSIVDKSSDILRNLTAKQKRLIIADMLVPSLYNEDAAHDWLVAFSVTLDNADSGERSLTEESLQIILGLEDYNMYMSTVGDIDSVAWVQNFRADIIKGIKI